MEFTLSFSVYSIRFIIEPLEDSGDNPTAKVSLIEIKDNRLNVDCTYDFAARKMSIKCGKVNNSFLNDLKASIKKLRESIKNDTTHEGTKARLIGVKTQTLEYFKAEADCVTTDLKDYLVNSAKMQSSIGTFPHFVENFEAYLWGLDEKSDGHFSRMLSVSQLLPSIFGDGLSLTEQQIDSCNSSLPQIDESDEEYLKKQIVLSKRSQIVLSAGLLQQELPKIKVFYIQAHGISQKIVYTIDNQNDFMAQAIHKYARCAVKSNTGPGKFIRKWMKKFGIGTDYKIKPIAGEGYTVEVKTDHGWVYLADLGVGANQMMVLLFSLATIMFENGFNPKKKDDNISSKLIIIEEPEQNLHPCLQSKLAELFEDVAKDKSYKFLVETHSEYLIRRTQVLVAQKNLSEEELEKKNPFKVYYFPAADSPYDMKYTTSGRFEKTFGEGFFDEASSSALTISRIERRRKNG